MPPIPSFILYASLSPSSRPPSSPTSPTSPRSPTYTLRAALATCALSASLVFPPLPGHCVPIIPPVDPEQSFVYEAWKLVNDYFVDPNFHQVDWKSELNTLLDAPLTDHKASYKALKRSLKKLNDRYTRVLNPDQMNALRKFDVSGVGLLLTEDVSGALVVAATPAPSTSAAEAGVKRGDVVLEVQGENVQQMQAFQVAQLMQGPTGSVLKVKFRDRGETELVRNFQTKQPAVVAVKVVDTEQGKMGYIKLNEFKASARAEVSDALQRVEGDGAEWVVLDLRGNGGGVFEGAMEISALFEGPGHTVARVRGRTDEFQDVYKSVLVKGDKQSNLDLAIVMDERSASASEVLAGALRDECRAAIVGSNSFGKGIIQGVFGMSDGGGIVITVAEYRTPKGIIIDKLGIKPDIEMRAKGLSRVLQVLGVEKFDESSVNVDRAQVQRVVKACQVQDI